MRALLEGQDERREDHEQEVHRQPVRQMDPRVLEERVEREERHDRRRHREPRDQHDHDPRSAPRRLEQADHDQDERVRVHHAEQLRTRRRDDGPHEQRLRMAGEAVEQDECRQPIGDEHEVDGPHAARQTTRCRVPETRSTDWRARVSPPADAPKPLGRCRRPALTHRLHAHCSRRTRPFSPARRRDARQARRSGPRSADVAEEERVFEVDDLPDRFPAGLSDAVGDATNVVHLEGDVPEPGRFAAGAGS